MLVDLLFCASIFCIGASCRRVNVITFAFNALARSSVPLDSRISKSQRLQTFVEEVKSASPDTKVVVPKYFEPVAIR